MENVEEKRIPFAEWEVGGETYKLKLSTSEITSLENYFKCSLLQLVDGTPSLTVMLKVVHAAMKKFNHRIKMEDMYDLFDKYIEEGGSQIEFMTNVFIPVYQASGFFSGAQSSMMTKKLDEANEQM